MKITTPEPRLTQEHFDFFLKDGAPLEPSRSLRRAIFVFMTLIPPHLKFDPVLLMRRLEYLFAEKEDERKRETLFV